ISLSQWKSQMNQAINKHKNSVRRYNSEINRAISNYNAQVRQYNNTVRSNRQTLIRALNAFKRITSASVDYTVSYRLRPSVERLNQSFQALETEARHYDGAKDLVITYPEQETANSVLLYNSLNGTDLEGFHAEES